MQPTELPKRAVLSPARPLPQTRGDERPSIPVVPMGRNGVPGAPLRWVPPQRCRGHTVGAGPLGPISFLRVFWEMLAEGL